MLFRSQDLTPDDIDPAQIAAAGIIYLEGYLWDPKNAKDAFVKAATIAHGAGRQVALTLSDSFCVDRYRDEFLDLMRKGIVDLVFSNESELHSLYQTADFDTALKQFGKDTKLGVVTRSEKGCVVISGDGVVSAPAYPIDKLVDTTGAGDTFNGALATFLHLGLAEAVRRAAAAGVPAAVRPALQMMDTARVM